MPYGAPVGYLNYGSPTSNPFSYKKIEQVTRDNTLDWITLDEIKQQLNLYGDDSQDDYLTVLEIATRQAIEDFLGMPIFAQSFRIYYGSENATVNPFYLDLPEISQTVNVTAVYYYNASNTQVAISGFYYDQSGNKVVITDQIDDINTDRTAPIVVEYTVMPNPIAQNEVIKHAGKLLFTHLYNNRSDTMEGKLNNIPFGVQVLLRPYKQLVM